MKLSFLRYHLPDYTTQQIFIEHLFCIMPKYEKTAIVAFKMLSCWKEQHDFLQNDIKVSGCYESFEGNDLIQSEIEEEAVKEGHAEKVVSCEGYMINKEVIW